MENRDTSGKAFINFWAWASDKGEMNHYTAASYKKACSQILHIEEQWETLDVRSIDIENFCKRFQNKRSQDFKPDTLSLYINTFRKAVRSFLDYVNNPITWKFQTKKQKTPKSKKIIEETKNFQIQQDNTQQQSTVISILSSQFIKYPFPLGEKRLAYFELPIDLKTSEVKRLTAHLQTLAIDAEI